MTGGRVLQKRIKSNLREIIFGLEDSLVSTLGAVTGIAAGTGNSFVVILSGIVLIFVESLSMSAGSYLSSKSVAQASKKQKTSKMAAIAGVVMGVFYLAGGVFPLLPYFFLSVQASIAPSIILTAVILFFIGVWKAKVVHVSPIKSGLEMMAVSLTAAMLGFIIGRAVALAFGITIV